MQKQKTSTFVEKIHQKNFLNLNYICIFRGFWKIAHNHTFNNVKMVLVLNSIELLWKRKVAISFQPELGPLGGQFVGIDYQTLEAGKIPKKHDGSKSVPEEFNGEEETMVVKTGSTLFTS